jgi:hypothetical protein
MLVYWCTLKGHKNEGTKKVLRKEMSQQKFLSAADMAISNFKQPVALPNSSYCDTRKLTSAEGYPQYVSLCLVYFQSRYTAIVRTVLKITCVKFSRQKI